jgi:hypothetical protein
MYCQIRSFYFIIIGAISQPPSSKTGSKRTSISSMMLASKSTPTMKVPRAVQALQKKANFSDGEGLSWVNDEPDDDLSELVEVFVIRHKPIKKHLCTGIKLKLQHIDLLIAERVVNHFTRRVYRHSAYMTH